MKYFVTGATGFIGGRVTQQLLAAGHEVLALARKPAQAQYLADMGTSIAQGDITDKESMRPAMLGVDGVFHMAAWYKVGAKDKTMAEHINVGGTRNVLELMQELHIAKGVYTSTLAVFSDTQGRMVDESYYYAGPHLTEYDRTKWLAHYAVAETLIDEGLPLVIVLPGAVYGPGDTSLVGETFARYLRGQLPMLPVGTRLCWAFVDDIARGHILAMEKGQPGESYIIAGPPGNVEEVIEMAARFTGVEPPAIYIPPRVTKLLAELMAVVGAFVPLPTDYSPENLRVLAGSTYLGSNQKAKRDLGYDLRPLEQGLQETFAYMLREVGMSPA